MLGKSLFLAFLQETNNNLHDNFIFLQIHLGATSIYVLENIFDKLDNIFINL
jgi:hypothetical protein